ncbi:unnamed protein product [Blepharisma stoltei]|uniref:Uncharacterized protein n=1 Tax=Blepharisma stoltei TaxID=1481888 RepID=A0AAU9JPX3_9CILI|nr:unnamed protein product [Blepharisma stoltei]
MALRLARVFRRSGMPQLATRGRPAADTEVADEIPHDFYVVKDYERNLFYGQLSHAQRPGYKKRYDPFKKFSERQEHAWTPRYRNQQFDAGTGWITFAFILLLPFEFIVLFYLETKYKRYRYNPLAYNLGIPHEL